MSSSKVVDFNKLNNVVTLHHFASGPYLASRGQKEAKNHDNVFWPLEAKQRPAEKN